jgi:hypothetical protein
MITIKHKPLKQKNGDFNNHYEITGNSIPELLEVCLTKIREKSKDFYREEITNNLRRNGKSGIDIHAGMGYLYTIKLTNAPTSV